MKCNEKCIEKIKTIRMLSLINEKIENDLLKKWAPHILTSNAFKALLVRKKPVSLSPKVCAFRTFQELASTVTKYCKLLNDGIGNKNIVNCVRNEIKKCGYSFQITELLEMIG